MRKTGLLFVLIIPLMVFAGEVGNKKIDSILRIFVQHEALASSNVSFILLAPDGSKYASFQEDKLMMPASVMKVVTTATAMQLLGPNYTYFTRFGYAGKIFKDTLQGNLLIEGGGDPSLGSIMYHPTITSEAFMNEWLLKIKSLKIKSIQGKIMYDDTYFQDHHPISTWLYEDIANYYGAMPGGLNWKDNMFTFTVKGSKKHGEKAVIESVDDYLKPKKIIVETYHDSSVHRDQSYLFPGEHLGEWIWKGSIPLGSEGMLIRGTMPDPAEKLAIHFKQFLAKHQINFQDTPSDSTIRKNEKTMLYQIKSAPLKDLIKSTNMQSINLFAEAFVKSISKENGGVGNTDDGIKKMIQYWANQSIDLSTAHIEDGSGLSRMNVLQATNIAAILLAMHQSKNNQFFKQSLPVCGESGTLQSFGRNLSIKGKMLAKTGTMEGVMAYAGYFKTKNNTYYPFCFLLNHYTKPTKEIRKVLEQFFNDIYLQLP